MGRQYTLEREAVQQSASLFNYSNEGKNRKIKRLLSTSQAALPDADIRTINRHLLRAGHADSNRQCAFN
jgi:hypothetical protein